MPEETAPVTSRLPAPRFSAAWCVIAAFGAYFCMYAFRKPFTAGAYADASWHGVAFKTLLVAAQVLGYTVSKFLGIKYIAEIRPGRRVFALLVLIGFAEISLFFFGIVPAPYNLICLFFNGLPLGMVFGLVLGFLEGRRQTEALTAGLCASFIIADGVTKSVGAGLLAAGVPEVWMPFLAGLLFVAPLLLFAWMLSRVPPPNAADVVARSERAPLNSAERWRLFRRYALGLILIIILYLAVTVLRSVRADFAPEIWSGLGTTGQPNVYAVSEILVAVTVLSLCALAVFIRDNRTAFFTALGLSGLGLLVVALALTLLQNGMINAFTFMVLHGLGLYLPYVAIHTTIYERLIAMTRDRGNIGYLMYLADAFGYLGYVAVMIARNFLSSQEKFLEFFLWLSWVIVAVGLPILVPVFWYFATHPATRRATPVSVHS